MHHARGISPALLPWLFPLALLVLVVSVAFAPGWLVGLVGVVVFYTLGYGGLALYSRRSQPLDKRTDPK